MGWIVPLVLFVASFFIQRALAPKPGKPRPAALSDFDIPQIDATRAIPVLFGTGKLMPTITWYGDLKSVGFSVNGQPAGFHYFLGLDLALCHGPVDSVDEILFGDDKPPWGYSSTIGDHDRYRFRYPTLPLNIIGITQGQESGEADVYKGTTTQGPNDYLQAKASADWPGHPRLAHVVLRQIYVGDSAYIRPISFIATRCPNQLGMTGNHHCMNPTPFGFDANPACMLYEILTDTTWGLSIAPAEIDAASFIAAGETLFAESLGLSMQLEQASAASDVIAEIERHVNGDLFKDPLTGKYSFALVRNDYTIGTLPVLDPSNVGSIESTRGSWSETSNVIRVEYASRLDNFANRIAQWQNLSNLQMRGETAVVDLSFRGISNATAAAVVAARVGKVLSFPLARWKLNGVNRESYALRVGSPFILNWPPLGISNMVCRVSRPASGELTDNKITLEAEEDAGAIAGTGYSAPGGTGWSDPNVPPTVPISTEKLIEAPYQLFGGVSSDPVRKALALAARSEANALGFEVWSDPAGGTAYAKTNSIAGWCPTGTLTASYAATTAALDATGFTIQNLTDPDELESGSTSDLYHGVNLALIDNEIIAWQTVAGTGATRTITNVLRGVLDTVPGTHSAGAVVYFFTAGPLGVVNASSYVSDVTVKAKLLPFNVKGALAIGSATQLSLTTASRATLPLPPGKIRVDGIIWPATRTAGVNIVLTWAYRHRIDQAAAGVIVSQDDPDYTAFPESDFKIEVRVDDILKRTVTVANNTWTWTAAMQATDTATAGKAIQIRIIPVGGSLVGTYHVRQFNMV